MANDAGQNKTEQATPRRIQEARRKGQVAKSQELTGAFVLLSLVTLMATSSEWYIEQFYRLFTLHLRSFSTFNVDERSLVFLVQMELYNMLVLLAPMLAVALIIAVLSNLAQVGFLFAPGSLAPKLERISPVSGLQRIFSTRSLFELGKACAKVLVVFILAYLILKAHMLQLFTLTATTPAAGFVTVTKLLVKLTVTVGIGYLVLALADFAYQRVTYNRSLMMTRTELKEDLKHAEGDPYLKSWIRQRQRQMALNRIRQEVPRATVVVTNPTHFAVALRYEGHKMAAPQVVAKGADRMAALIKDLAREHNVPVVENRDVARYLYWKVDVGKEIPVQLYQAVAEILAFVYRLKVQKRAG
ncbi:flagellar biosynthesis protein FlhB [Desulforudis sp. 1088]|uniref:flagellar biosynthesis protein FlhB n=1 Tax=unclassified Candidatus Desulforudis TaxID=2635950 RepID=UPI003CE53E67